MRTEDLAIPGAADVHWTGLITLVARILTLGALISPPPAGAQFSLGNILVIDPRGGTDTRAELFRVDAATSARTVLSDFNNSAQGEEGFGLTDVAVEASGSILVVESSGGELFRVDPTTGARIVVSDFDDPAQGPRGREPVGMTVDVSNILVLDDEAVGVEHDGCCSGVLFSVDPTTGDRTVVSDFDDPAQGAEGEGALRAVAVDAAGNILVLDASSFLRTRGALFKVDPSSGFRTILSDFNNSVQGVPLPSFPNDMTIDSSGNIWVIDREMGTNHSGMLFTVNPTTGARTVVSDFGDPAQGELGVDPSGVAIDGSGSNILVIDPDSGTSGGGMLFIVNPTSGARTVVSDFGNPAQGVLGETPAKVAVALPTPTLQPVDLTIANMEITQAIQNFANNVPLVQDKTTYVRVYPGVDVADTRVGARLRGFRGGAELPGSPLRPLYPLATVHPGGASRRTSNDSFNFWVPPTWRSGNVSFQAEINFGGAVPETDTSNNTFSLPMQFTRKAPVCVVMIPVHTHGSRYTVDSPGFDSIIARFQSLWPVPDVWVYYQTSPVEELQARFGIPPFEFGPYELPEDKRKIILSLILRAHWTDDPDECEDRKARTHYVGMVSPDTNEGVREGAGDYAFAAAYVKMRADPAASKNVPFFTPRGGADMAHELSHNYNGIPPLPIIHERWLHAPCPPPPREPKPTNNNYPFDAAAGIGPIGLDTYWGFDPITRAIIAPDAARDYMSYCTPAWVSDYNWKGMFEEINSVGSARVQSLERKNGVANVNQGAEEILLLGGTIVPTANRASFEYAYRLPQGVVNSIPDSPETAEDPFVLELVNTNGAVLLAKPFNSRRVGDGEDVSDLFFLIVPFNPEAAQVRILQNGQELGALTVSAHEPQVRLLEPIGAATIADRLDVRWEASDEDDDLLLYTVQYSADLGASWQALVTQTPETALTLDDTRSLPGSNQKALIRVIANDGMNTGADVSDPFTVQPHVPVARIDTPSDEAIFELNSQITFMGGARDAEDGQLGDGALTWLVDGQRLGSGKEIALAGLKPGTHVIRLEAADSDNNTAAASVTITIVSGMPVASADSYSVPEDTPLTVDAPGVLGNDIGAEGDRLSAVLVSNVSNGTLMVNSDGSFTYTPNVGFNGADSFTYKANDGVADSNVVTVSIIAGIEVDPIGEPPSACTSDTPTNGCTVNGVRNRPCVGTARNDRISGTHGDDIIFGLEGNDRINGLFGNDLICGGEGNDILRGKLGRDRIFGGPGSDTLQGGTSGDQLLGEDGNDQLYGDRGDDVLDGGADADWCHGGKNSRAGDSARNCETVIGVP